MDANLIKNLSEKLSIDELTLFYDLWIDKISLRYTPKGIEKHLIKHLNEDSIFSHDWLVSADNLKDIYFKVKNADLDSELIKKYESILNNEKFSAEAKLERLLSHYINYPDSSTPPAFESAQEFRKNYRE
jgi:hypothetical protein